MHARIVHLFFLPSLFLSFLPFFFTSYRGLQRILNAQCTSSNPWWSFLVSVIQMRLLICCCDLDVQPMFISFLLLMTQFKQIFFGGVGWHLRDTLTITFQMKENWELVHFVSASCLFCVCMYSHDQQAGWHCHAGLVYRADVCHCFTDPSAPHRLLHKEEQRRQISGYVNVQNWCEIFKRIHVVDH